MGRVRDLTGVSGRPFGELRAHVVRRRPRFMLMLFAAVGVILATAACEGDVSEEPGQASPTAITAPTTEPALFPFVVTGSNGKETVFEEPPERIVAFDSAVVEILFAIGEGHRIVGTHDFVTFPPETADVARVGSAFDMNIEATVALDPDLVFVFSEGDVAALERADLRVLYLESLGSDFRRVSDNIRLWGRIVGNPGAADDAAGEFDNRVDAIEERMEAVEQGQRVFQDEGDLWTPGPDTLVGEVMTLLKLQNIAYDVSSYVQLSPEIVVERDPEIIIASYGDTISNIPAFKDVTAIKEKRVFVPPSDALSIAGPRFVEGVEALAKWVYPEVFE